jgi:hypothetical protein
MSSSRFKEYYGELISRRLVSEIFDAKQEKHVDFIDEFDL